MNKNSEEGGSSYASDKKSYGSSASTNSSAIEWRTDKNSKTPILCGSARLMMAFLGFFGCLIVFATRTNTHFAVVCMINGTALRAMSNSSDTAASACRNPSLNSNDGENEVIGEFSWKKHEQEYIISSYFIGYLFCQVPGGLMAMRFGGKLCLTICVISSSIISLITPFAARQSINFFIGLRILLGILQACLFPSFHEIWSRWAPPLERSLLTGITYSGTQFGIVTANFLSGILCKYGFAGGWPSIYYVLGIFGLLWTIAWVTLAASRPSSSRIMRREERIYLEDYAKTVEKKNANKKEVPVPWSKLLTSLPIWAVFVGHVAGDWGAYVMMTNIAMFMKDVLGFDTASMGFYAAIPYVIYAAMISISGAVADSLQDLKILSTLTVRRLAMIIGLGGQAVFMMATAYCGCGQEMLAVLFVILGLGLSGAQFSGYLVSYIDLAPRFAGTIFGIGNTMGGISGCLCPLVIGWITPTGSRKEWRTVFGITAAILVFGSSFYCIFVKADVQPWAAVEDDFDNIEANSNNKESTNKNTK